MRTHPLVAWLVADFARQWALDPGALLRIAPPGFHDLLIGRWAAQCGLRPERVRAWMEGTEAIPRDAVTKIALISHGEVAPPSWPRIEEFAFSPLGAPAQPLPPSQGMQTAAAPARAPTGRPTEHAEHAFMRWLVAMGLKLYEYARTKNRSHQQFSNFLTGRSPIPASLALEIEAESAGAVPLAAWARVYERPRKDQPARRWLYGKPVARFPDAETIAEMVAKSARSYAVRSE